MGGIGSAFGSTLGRNLLHGEVAQAIGSTLFGALGENLAEALTLTIGTDLDLAASFESAFADFGANIASLGSGAISSYLVGELFDHLGIHGPVGDFTESLASQYVTRIIQNLPKLLRVISVAFPQVSLLAKSRVRSGVLSVPT